MSMMSVLDKSITIISPDRNKKEIGDLRTRIIEAYHTTKVTTGEFFLNMFKRFYRHQDRDHLRLLARHKIIEERKEWLEQKNNAQQSAEIEKQRKELARQKQEEKLR